jgi:hypothetical protein
MVTPAYTNDMHISAEMSLLLHVSSPHPLLSEEEIRLLVSQLHPEKLYELAASHNIILLFIKPHNKASLALLPDDLHQHIHKTALQHGAKNIQLASELVHLSRLLAKKNIITVAFKGPALSQRLHSDVIYRFFGDLDITIDKQKVAAALPLLQKEGYSVSPHIALHHLTGYLATEHFISLHNRQKDIALDLHWDFTNKYAIRPLTFADIQTDLVQLHLDAGQITSLNKEDTLLQQTIHAASHCFEKLEFMSAVAHLICMEHDWEHIIRRAEKLHSLRLLLVGTKAACTLYNIPFPDPLAPFLKEDPRAATLAQQVVAALLTNGEFHPDHELHWRFNRLHIDVRKSYRDKLRYGVQLLFQPTISDWEALPGLAPMWPLYILFRPCRLLYNCFLKLGSKVRRQE